MVKSRFRPDNCDCMNINCCEIQKLQEEQFSLLNNSFKKICINTFCTKHFVQKFCIFVYFFVYFRISFIYICMIIPKKNLLKYILYNILYIFCISFEYICIDIPKNRLPLQLAIFGSVEKKLFAKRHFSCLIKWDGTCVSILFLTSFFPTTTPLYTSLILITATN